MGDSDWMGFIVFLLICLLALTVRGLILLRRLRQRLDEQKRQRDDDMDVLMREMRNLRVEPTQPADTPPPPAPVKPVVSAPLIPPPLAAPAQVPPVPVAATPVHAPHTAVPQAPAPTAPQAEHVDSAAARILRETWNWLIVGSEYRRPGVSIEEAVATNWLIRIGVLVLVVGIGFFLKDSIDRGLLGPQARVAMCFLTGAGLIGGGVRLFGRRYHILGQGLAGAGVATLYFAVFAAAGLFHLIPLPAGFVLMAFVTLAAGILAVRHQTVLLAMLGTLGGHLTPVMLSQVQGSDLWLFGYLLLLALGITGVAWRQRWPALTYMSFVCHNALFFHAVHWNACATTLPFFAAYFVLYTTAIFLPVITRDKQVSALEPIGLFLVAAVFLYGGYELVLTSFNRTAVAWVTIGMAAYYTAHVYFFLRRRAQDRAFLATFLGLAGGALTLTLPLLLSHAWLTMAWSVLALVAMWVSQKLESPFLRALALALHGFVACKLGSFDLLAAYGDLQPASLGAYGPELLAHTMQFGVPVASFWLSSRLLVRLPADMPEQDARPRLGAWGIVCLVAMYALLFLVLNIELFHVCGLLWAPCQGAALTLIWVVFGLHLLARHERLGDGLCIGLALLVLLALIGKFICDFAGWDPELEHGVYDQRAQDGGTLLRLADAGMLVAYLALAWRVWRQRAATRFWAWACGYVALAILFLHLTFETATVSDLWLPGFRGGSVSIFWALFAFALIFSGIRWQVRTLRGLGLVLFTVIVAKVFLVDLSHLASVYRIAALVVLGIVLLLAAIVYLRHDRPAARDRIQKE